MLELKTASGLAVNVGVGVPTPDKNHEVVLSLFKSRFVIFIFHMYGIFCKLSTSAD